MSSFRSDQKLETAVVILLYNGRKLLEELLPIALEHTPVNQTTQLVLADNCSTDDTQEWLEKYYPEVPLLKFEKNHGFTGGYNRALSLIDAEYYILLSNDVEVSSNWLEPIISLFNSDKYIGAIQPKVKSYYHKEKFEYAGAAGGYIDNWGIPFCSGRVFNEIENDYGQYDEIKELFWASGCCFAVRSEPWHNAKGLDPDYFAHMEEIDLSWRFQAMGYKIRSCPSSVVYHMGGQTLGYDNPKKLLLNYRNNLAMLTKNWPLSKLILQLPVRILIDWLAAFYFLFSKGISHFVAVFKGHIAFISKFRFWFNKRKHTPKIRWSNTTGVYKGSIIWSFYFKKVKRFSKLNLSRFTSF